MTLHVYGIPNCSTCKKAIAWLTAQQIEYTFIDLKQHPPDPQSIAAWVTTLGNKPLRNTSGQSYRALGASKESWNDADWIAAFSQDAMLLKRPLFVQAGQAIAVGFRDPEGLKALIQST
jgi:arsenate reductase (glutaredoxin)